MPRIYTGMGCCGPYVGAGCLTTMAAAVLAAAVLAKLDHRHAPNRPRP